MNKVFSQLWDQLRLKKPRLSDFLEEIHIQHIRGIGNLQVRLEFPVTVLAGPNGSGKSTILFAAACAYEVPGAGKRAFVPSALFPSLRTTAVSDLGDREAPSSFSYYYTHKGRRQAMRWSRGKTWNKSFMGQQGGRQPERILYMRTLANLTSPGEIRSFLQIATTTYETSEVTSDLIAFAQRIVPNRYRSVKLLEKGEKNLLFVDRADIQAQYSEFHMSAGERAILRISKDISSLQHALVLIDEIEAGLHPYTQQQLMLELQRLALRNNLQIIVTTHSPVVIDTVPPEARIFLERTADNVQIQPAYRGIIQKAFYGQSLEKLSILCEDDMAEAFLYGIMDVLNPRLRLVHDDLVIGGDTGKDMFAQHIEAIGKFNLLDGFVFVLDGDARGLENNLKLAAEKYGKTLQPLFLPGSVPEQWAWQVLRQYAGDYASELGLDMGDMEELMAQFDRLYDNATDKPTNIIKNKFYSFCERIRRSETELMRRVAAIEAQRRHPELVAFVEDFEMQLRNWQARMG
ncbi:MAG: hypothetical protein OHK0039_17610 [Bacteroidia bacterium]